MRGDDRNDLLRLFNDGSLANIPGVENVINPFEMSPDSQIEQVMGIGDNHDATILDDREGYHYSVSTDPYQTFQIEFRFVTLYLQAILVRLYLSTNLFRRIERCKVRRL